MTKINITSPGLHEDAGKASSAAWWSLMWTRLLRGYLSSTA